jgi:hypothetical protein
MACRAWKISATVPSIPNAMHVGVEVEEADSGVVSANSRPSDEDFARAAGASGGEWGDDQGDDDRRRGRKTV